MLHSGVGDGRGSITGNIGDEVMGTAPNVDHVNVVQIMKSKGVAETITARDRTIGGSQSDLSFRIIAGMLDESRPELLRVSDDVEQAQFSALQSLRQTRDNARVSACLEALRVGAESDANLIPLMLDAVRAYASVGEVCQALVPVFGCYRETSVL